jgi:hypothetical protein
VNEREIFFIIFHRSANFHENQHFFLSIFALRNFSCEREYEFAHVCGFWGEMIFIKFVNLNFHTVWKNIIISSSISRRRFRLPYISSFPRTSCT